ncbi:hypothetical protein OAG68_01310 [bacterium]|nr:hypothetical protein [bacterium]
MSIYWHAMFYAEQKFGQIFIDLGRCFDIELRRDLRSLGSTREYVVLAISKVDAYMAGRTNWDSDRSPTIDFIGNDTGELQKAELRVEAPSRFDEQRTRTISK